MPIASADHEQHMTPNHNQTQLSEAEHRSLLRLAQGGQQQQQRTDFDVLREHFRFAWREGEEDESTCTW